MQNTRVARLRNQEHEKLLTIKTNELKCTYGMKVTCSFNAQGHVRHRYLFRN